MTTRREARSERRAFRLAVGFAAAFAVPSTFACSHDSFEAASDGGTEGGSSDAGNTHDGASADGPSVGDADVDSGVGCSAVPSAIFCDDFESNPSDGGDLGKWTQHFNDVGTTLGLVTSESRSPTHSLRAALPSYPPDAGPTLAAYADLVFTKTFSTLPTKLRFTFFLQLHHAPPTGQATNVNIFGLRGTKGALLLHVAPPNGTFGVYYRDTSGTDHNVAIAGSDGVLTSGGWKKIVVVVTPSGFNATVHGFTTGDLPWTHDDPMTFDLQLGVSSPSATNWELDYDDVSIEPQN